MENIDEQLMIKKTEIDNIEIPDELESRLKNALESVEEKPKNQSKGDSWVMRHKWIAAVLALVLFTGIYNYDVLAYYGKKIIGYDEVVYGSLKDLNEMGMGQEINQSYKFKNGTEVILDGIMMDDNKLTAMYKVISDSAEKANAINVWSIEGRFNSYQSKGGSGKSNDSGTEIWWVIDFEDPSLFEKRLSLNITSSLKDESAGEQGKIEFRLDFNKAIKRSVSTDINKVIEFEGIRYCLNNLSATPLSIVLKGSIEADDQKVIKLFTSNPAGSNSVRRNLNVELVGIYDRNGKETKENIEGGLHSIGSDGKKVEFECEFYGIKPNLKKLQLNLVKLEDMRIIDTNININTKTSNVNVVPDSDEAVIKEVKEESGNTVITFITQKDVTFMAGLFIGDKQAEGIEVVPKTINADGKEVIEKIYRFKGFSKDMKLMIKTISHETYINKEISLYEEK